MRCYVCHKPQTDDAVRAGSALLEDEPTFDAVTDAYGLVHCDGPDDLFTAEGWTVVCPPCIERVEVKS